MVFIHNFAQYLINILNLNCASWPITLKTPPVHILLGSIVCKWTQSVQPTIVRVVSPSSIPNDSTLIDEIREDPSNADDYANIYPEDVYMEEMGENARVWRVYLDESDRIDAATVDGWRSTLDTLLIFVRIGHRTHSRRSC